MYSETIVFINDFLITNCTKTYLITKSLKIILKDRRLILNPKESVGALLSLLGKQLLKRTSNPVLTTVKVNVGKKDHESKGFLVEKEGEISPQTAKTYQQSVKVQGNLYRTEDYNINNPFKLPEPNELFTEGTEKIKYGSKQFSFSSYVDKNTLTKNEIKTLDQTENKVIEDKYFILESLKWAKLTLQEKDFSKALEKATLNSLKMKETLFTQNTIKPVENSLKLLGSEKRFFVLQCKDPKKSSNITQSEIVERIGIMEKNFIEEIKEAGELIANFFEKEDIFCSIEDIEKTANLISSTEFSGFYSLLNTVAECTEEC